MGKTGELTVAEAEAERKLRNDISVRLRGLLDERGWTVYKLIDESGVSKNSIYNAYNARAGIQTNTLLRICNTLDVSISEFFSYQVSSDINLSQEERMDLLNRRQLDPAAQKRISAYIKALVDEKNSDKK